MLPWPELISRDTDKATLNFVLSIGTNGDISDFKESNKQEENAHVV